ncbi:MAG: hypothetical protein IPM23_11255 [Candidatus Melainabacteria bacterium]|nr:hypothetical protein [Candidatus Melainabacteria bacterium]
MIEQLTAGQEADLESYFERIRSPVRSPEAESEPARLEAAINRIYSELELAAPVTVVCDSPWQMAVCEALACLCRGAGLEPRSFLEDLRQRLSNPLWLACLDRLEAHPELLAGPESSSTSIRQLRASIFGKSTGPPMRFLISRLISEEGSRARDRLLSVRVQLKLRDTLKTRLANALPELDGFRLMRQFGVEIPESLREFFNESPFQGFFAALEETSRPALVRSPAGEFFSTFHPPGLAADRIAEFPLFAFVYKNLGLSEDPELVRRIEAWQTLFDAAFNWCGYERAIFLSRQPVELLLDERRRLHREDGPALSFPDGYRICSIHGVLVPESVVTDPSSLSLEIIEGETNVEIRRIMIQRFGMERYIEESGAVAIDSDDCGVLYRKEQKLDEPLVVVKVVDSTSLIQGEPRHYFLRVPPYMTSARQAVAWTFNLNSGEYSPSEQT